MEHMPTPTGRSRRFLHFYFSSVLGGCDAFFDERIPVVTVRTLPQQFGAAIAAAQADVRIEIEDRVLRQLAVVIDERCRMTQLAERAPDRLVDAERMRILDERGEEQFERVLGVPTGRQMS